MATTATTAGAMDINPAPSSSVAGSSVQATSQPATTDDFAEIERTQGISVAARLARESVEKKGYKIRILESGFDLSNADRQQLKEHILRESDWMDLSVAFNPPYFDDLQDRTVIAVAAGKDGKFVGRVHLIRRSLSPSRIHRVGTESTHRRHGIATALLLTIFEKEQNGPMSLCTQVNSKAHKLFKRFGFIDAGAEEWGMEMLRAAITKNDD